MLVLDAALSIVALLAGVMALELFTARRAPLGSQDESSFPFATPAQPGPVMNIATRSELRRRKARPAVTSGLRASVASPV